MPVKRRTFCKHCGIETFNTSFHRGKLCSFHGKETCRSCSAKILYNKRGAFTHSNGKLFSEKETELLKQIYSNSEKEELCKLFGRNWSSISHKAKRLGLKRSRIFKDKSSIRTLQIVNANPENRLKTKTSLIRRWSEGRGVLTGIALKSKMGLTKKENHPNWQGGISFEPYDARFDKSFKKQIKERDSYICQICNEPKKILCVHHINYDKQLSIPQNCITLCNICHVKTNYHRKQWTTFFQQILNEKYGYEYSEAIVIRI
jgi:hypothetical protein